MKLLKRLKAKMSHFSTSGIVESHLSRSAVWLLSIGKDTKTLEDIDFVRGKFHVLCVLSDSALGYLLLTYPTTGLLGVPFGIVVLIKMAVSLICLSALLMRWGALRLRDFVASVFSASVPLS